MSETLKRRWSDQSRWAVSVLALAAAACGSDVTGNGPGGGSDPNNPNNPNPGPGPMIEMGVDPGRVEIHRLNNTEYNNTVRDLLGTATQPAAKFLAEEGNAFDNTASALGMTGAQYEKYLNAASDLMLESLGTEAIKARFLTCV